MSEPKEVKPEEKKEEKQEPKPAADDDDSGGDEDYDPQEEIWRDVENQVNLPEIKVETGEEDDELIASFRAKLYRWRGEWKERGTGMAKFLKRNAKTNDEAKIRLLIRADKTLKVIANHMVWREGPLGRIEALKTANNAWMFAAYDFSEVEPRCEKFAIRIPKEDYERFFREYQKAIDWNHKVPPIGSEVERDRFLEKQEQDRKEEREKKRQAEASKEAEKAPEKKE